MLLVELTDLQHTIARLQTAHFRCGMRIDRAHLMTMEIENECMSGNGKEKWLANNITKLHNVFMYLQIYLFMLSSAIESRTLGICFIAKHAQWSPFNHLYAPTDRDPTWCVSSGNHTIPL